MLANVKPLSTDHGFTEGSKLFVYQEVIDNNDGAIRVHEYYDTGIHNETFTFHVNFQRINFDCIKKFQVWLPNSAFVERLHVVLEIIKR